MKVRRGARALAIPALAAVAVTELALPAVQAAERRLRDVVYDYAVTSYCGTLTPEVEAGFRVALSQLTEDRGLSPEEARAQRIEGWVAADMEWSNRGLGGYRAWCRSEGVDAARRFRAFVPGSGS